MEPASFPAHLLQAFSKLSLEYYVVQLGVHLKVLHRGGRSTTCFGYPCDSFAQQMESAYKKMIFAEDLVRVSEAICEARETKQDFELLFHVIQSDHTVAPCHVFGTYLYTLEGFPVFLILPSDDLGIIFPSDKSAEAISFSFVASTGLLLEGNLQFQRAFRVTEVPSLYEAVHMFVLRYVHPQDQKMFDFFADRASLLSSFPQPTGENIVLFRRASYDGSYQGYRWSILSVKVSSGPDSEELICMVSIRDVGSESAASQAHLDPLTGVLNRSALERGVVQALVQETAKGEMGAFFVLDIDHFKWVNDTYGHDVGDRTLQFVANSIKGIFRPHDIIARLGGDEFAVFITGIPSQELAIAKAEALCSKIRIPQGENQITCSVGISLYPEHGTTFETLYHSADLAMYQAKTEGRDRYCLYGTHGVNPNMRKPVDKQWLFSLLQEEIYLCNLDTYELLFANDTLVKRLGIINGTARGPCYQILHKRSSPCEDCKNLLLKPNQTSSWIGHDRQNGTLFLVRERSLLSKGIRVKLSVSTPLPPCWNGALMDSSLVDGTETTKENSSGPPALMDG
ncbi:GGDEF domain-containing protein [Sphaerochaeta sp. PS]|uniref:GGDEF domain-containing protein n=1 Tax=Sphaerochaeta sp. PS TaxID=3076336 RepID=UPI0028A55BB1|nr:GGDEF domain-containing protein [Sphaerochaeta sp. PS]MDT4762880.1 GGDEF domain-containing protein [Sphaerochaeta sp. PS]